MKKILSLFLSLVLVSFMIIGSFTSAVFAADGEISLAKEKLDLMGNKLVLTRGVFWDFDTTSSEGNFGNETVRIGKHRDDNNTRLEINGSIMNTCRGGTVTISYWLYVAASDGYLAIRPRPNGVNNQNMHVNLNDSNYFNLVPYKWYNIVAEANLDEAVDNYKVTAVDSSGNSYGSRTMSVGEIKNGYLGLVLLYISPASGEMPDGSEEDKKGIDVPFYAVKDVYVSHCDGTKKSEILSVGSDGEVMHSQSGISFKLSKEITGLTKDHIIVKNKVNSSDTVAVSSIDSVQDDGTGYVVNATLSQNLAPWTDYYLEIKGDVYTGYKEITSDGMIVVSSFNKEFHTPSAPFDLKDPDFTYDGSDLKAETKMINTTGAKDVCFVLASYSSEGKIISVTKKDYPAFEAAYPGSDADISAPAVSGDILRLFVIDNMQNKNALFGKSWTVNYDGTSADVFAFSSGENEVPGTISLGDFDYDQKKIEVDVKHITSDAASGILTVYSDASSPEYIDYITTGADGSYKKEISFAGGFTYGTYTVKFIPDGGEAIENNFTYYTPEQIKDNTRAGILTLAKQAPTAGALMQAILGIDEGENVINNNFEVFEADAQSAFYDLVKEKAEIFALMKKSISQDMTYPGLVALFNTSAEEIYDSENTPSAKPSTNNGSYGSSNTVITENKGSGTSGGGTSGGGVPTLPQTPENTFSDTKGHWAEKFTEELSERGIISGYTDGTFRPANNITRAELAKLLVEAFGNDEGNTVNFFDVAYDSWCYKYIASAFSQGIITGYEDGSFRPDSFITKQDAVLMLYRAMLIKNELPAGYKIFKDDLGISSYAQDATRCLGELGIITGNEAQELKPQNNITRAEVAAIICRGLDYLQSH